MTERPILFSGPMVRAILAGQKTQTRRVVKLRPLLDGSFAEPWFTSGPGHSGPGVYVSELELPDEGSFHVPCPYGVPGDRLWVRETWRGWCQSEGAWRARYAADGAVREDLADWDEGPYYQSPEDAGMDAEPDKWKPSIFMPRWASRITLEVTEVRVQRLQDLSEDDGQAEGITEPLPIMLSRGYIAAFSYLWDSINEKRGFGWMVNPWVWAITFRRLA